jgi:dihydroorotase
MSSDFCLLIRHARILLPTGEFLQGDVRTRGREIVQVAPEILPSDLTEVDKEIDAQGLTLLPGVIDPQVHFREPGLGT